MYVLRRTMYCVLCVTKLSTRCSTQVNARDGGGLAFKRTQAEHTKWMKIRKKKKFTFHLTKATLSPISLCI